MTLDYQQAFALSELLSSSLKQLAASTLAEKNGKWSSKTVGATHETAYATLADDAKLSSCTGEAPGTGTMKLRSTLQIVSAASQLIALVRPPEQYVWDVAMGYHLSSALRLVVESHVVEIIREKGVVPDGKGSFLGPALHVQDITALNHVHADKLERILRLLATHYIFVEVAPHTFALNAQASVLDTGKSLTDIFERPHDKYEGSNGLGALVALCTDESMRASLSLPETLLDPIATSSSEPLAAPFGRAWPGAERCTMFEWLSLPENEYRLKRFGAAMKGVSGMTPEDAILRGFDWASLPEECVVIDVGGGVGAASLPIVKNCPQVKLVIQDTEKMVEEGPKFWSSNYPQAVEQGRVSFQTQSFFEPQPSSSSSASVFLLRMVMHNWPNVECMRILGHVREAAKGNPAAKLVIVDSMLMYACHERGSADKGAVTTGDDFDDVLAPEPLLPNWGTANSLAYKFDVMMMGNHNAGERTLTEFRSLLERSGWKITEVHAAHHSWMPQIVAVPAPIPASGPLQDVSTASPIQANESFSTDASDETRVDADVDEMEGVLPASLVDLTPVDPASKSAVVANSNVNDVNLKRAGASSPESSSSDPITVEKKKRRKSLWKSFSLTSSARP